MDSDISLYFASVDTRRAACLVGAWAITPFVSSDRRRRALAAAVRAQLGKVEVFSYGSARGALAACLRAAGIGPGDTVLLSSFTCLAVPTAVLAVGARPEYVDIDATSLNTPAAAVIAALRPDVRAIVIQHTLGRGAEVETIAAEARKRNVLVIEDCALAVGSTRSGRPVGTFGDAAVFSMELSKLISTGWGGVLTVRDAGLARRVAEDYARVPEPPAMDTARRVLQAAVSGICYERLIFPSGRYAVAAAFSVGLFKPSTPPAEIEGRPSADFIVRLSSAQMVLATVQWRRLPQVASECAAHATCLRAALKVAGLAVLAESGSGDLSVTPRVPFLVADRRAAMRWFQARGIELGSWFDGPLSPLPDALIFNYRPECYPHALAVARHIVNLPSHCRLTRADIDRLRGLVEQYAAEHPADRAICASAAARDPNLVGV